MYPKKIHYVIDTNVEDKGEITKPSIGISGHLQYDVPNLMLLASFHRLMTLVLNAPL